MQFIEKTQVLHSIVLRFKRINGPSAHHSITLRGLHGLFYHVLQLKDSTKASWLHSHPPPKPYTLMPHYDTNDGALTGIRISALTDEIGTLLLKACQAALERNEKLRLGRQSFYMAHIEYIPGPDFAQLASTEPAVLVNLHFLSPTNFRQGPGDLPLPLPRLVFNRPYTVWQAFSPTHLQLPSDWLDWCEANIFIEAHHIQTTAVTISKRQPVVTGFIGKVAFRTRDKSILYQSIFQGLGALAPYCGIGMKTTMGMGAVVLLENHPV